MIDTLKDLAALAATFTLIYVVIIFAAAFA